MSILGNLLWKYCASNETYNMFDPYRDPEINKSHMDVLIY